MRPPADQAGLTRNEVIALAALAVVALAVALPYFLHQSRAAARTASLQNLRQWGIAFNLYLVENDHTLPAAGRRADDPAAWFNALPPYLSLPPLSATAPEAAGPGTLWADPAARPPAGAPAAARATYGMNTWLQPDPAAAAWRIYDIEDPSGTLFLVETAPGVLQTGPGGMTFRHGPGETGHALFCDGHAEPVTRAAAEAPAARDPMANPAARPTWVPFYQAPAPRD